jgi:hypothetical protein
LFKLAPRHFVRWAQLADQRRQHHRAADRRIDARPRVGPALQRDTRRKRSGLERLEDLGSTRRPLTRR